MKGGKRQAVSPRQHTPGWKFGTTTDKPPWGFDVSEDLNSCHPEDIDRPLKASDLRFGLLYRAIGQPSRHLNTAGFTGGSITGNITGRLNRPAFAMPPLRRQPRYAQQRAPGPRSPIRIHRKE
jgi:hypothetical protein